MLNVYTESEQVCTRERDAWIQHYQKKVITLFVAYTLLFLGIIAIGFYFFITTPLYSHAKETITNKADTVSLQINQDLDSLLPTINTLADFAAEYPAKTLLSQITHTLLTSLNNNTFIISGGSGQNLLL